LVNHRLTWLLVSQGFLFVAFTSLADKTLLGKRSILCVIAALGYLTSIVTFFSLCSAFKSHEVLRKKWKAPELQETERVMRKTKYPQVSFREPSKYRPMGVAGSLPLLVMAAWATLFCIMLFLSSPVGEIHWFILVVAVLFYSAGIIWGVRILVGIFNIDD